MSDPLDTLKKRRQIEFVEEAVFGQSSYGHRCRICLADDYEHPIIHEAWCEHVRALLTLLVLGPS